jgi:hypothetical protein
MVEGMRLFTYADETKKRMLQTKQLEFSTITNSLKLALAKLSTAREREKINADLMGYAGDMSTLNIDLNKNFDQNKVTNKGLDPANREYINRKHTEYRQLPAAFKKPFEESFKLFRKNYIQHTAVMMTNLFRSYEKDTPGLAPLITLLDIQNKSLNGGKNENPSLYYDAYSSNLNKNIFKVLKEANKLAVGETSYKADLHDIEKFYNAAVENPYMHLGRSGDYFMEFDVQDVPGAWEAVGNALSFASRTRRNVTRLIRLCVRSGQSSKRSRCTVAVSTTTKI